jgi:hypothetical protein
LKSGKVFNYDFTDFIQETSSTNNFETPEDVLFQTVKANGEYMHKERKDDSLIYSGIVKANDFGTKFVYLGDEKIYIGNNDELRVDQKINFSIIDAKMDYYKHKVSQFGVNSDEK